MLSSRDKIIILYAILVIIGIVGVYISRQGVIINSFDIMVMNVGWMIAPIGVALSILILHNKKIFTEWNEFPIYGRLIIHAYSVIFICWGFLGTLIIVNTMFSKDKDVLIAVKIVDAYSRGPKNDYKFSYSYTRYYIEFTDIIQEKTYHVQVREGFYDSVLSQKREVDNVLQLNQSFTEETVKFLKENNIKLPCQKQNIELKIPIGALGFWK